MKHLQPYFSMSCSLIFFERPVRPLKRRNCFFVGSANRYAAIFLPLAEVTRNVSSWMPSSRTSRAARGGWSYPYLFFNSSVVMCPCFRMWSITVFGRFAVTEAQSSRNSFGYFGVFAITRSGFHQLKLFAIPSAVDCRMRFQLLCQRRGKIQRLDRYFSSAQQRGLRRPSRFDFHERQMQFCRQRLPVNAISQTPIIADQVANIFVIQSLKLLDKIVKGNSGEISGVALAAHALVR